jgi:hypothetical protein
VFKEVVLNTKDAILADLGISDSGGGLFGKSAYFFEKGMLRGTLILEQGVSLGQAQTIVSRIGPNEFVLTASFVPVPTINPRDITEDHWNLKQLYYLLARGIAYQLGGRELLEMPELINKTGCQMKLISSLAALKSTFVNLSRR